MKKIIAVLSIMAISCVSFAQWTTSGSNIYNTNTGNVGIGTSSPSEKLHIIGNIRGNSGGGALRVNTQYGYTDIGLQNSWYSHFYTNISRGFYFNNSLTINGNISSYNVSDMNLQTYDGVNYYNRLTIARSNGNVGIGFTAPSQKLDVNGSVRGVSFISFSDERFKTNIRKFENPLDKLIQIQGVRYNFNKQKFADRAFPEGERDGLIAQQVQKVFPELVTADGDGYLAVDYVSLIPILIESIKELKTKVDLLKAEKIQHELTVDQKKALDRFKGAYLNQNAPNPSINGTSIEFNIPDNVFSASIVIHDYNGNQVKKYEITQKGQGKIDIQNSDIGSGIFLYSLLLDGTVLDVKRMILTRN